MIFHRQSNIRRQLPGIIPPPVPPYSPPTLTEPRHCHLVRETMQRPTGILHLTWCGLYRWDFEIAGEDCTKCEEESIRHAVEGVFDGSL